MSAAQIGKIYGCSRQPVTRVLKECGIELDTHLRKIPKSDHKKVIDLYNSGKTQQEIADKYNISRSYVSRIETKSLLKLRKYMLTNKIQL